MRLVRDIETVFSLGALLQANVGFTNDTHKLKTYCQLPKEKISFVTSQGFLPNIKLMKFLHLTIFMLFLSQAIFTQRIDYPVQFNELLSQVGIEFHEPADAGYKDIRTIENEYQEYEFAIWSRKEKLEMRYAVLPYDEKDVFSANPHILTARALTSIATNEEDSNISAIQLTEKALERDFNADWGMVYFFKPKIGFSAHAHCRMVALYKEDRGTVLIFHLFEKASNEALDTRYYALRFKALEEEN